MLRRLQRQFKQDCVPAIITHAHQDRIGGIDALAALTVAASVDVCGDFFT